MRSIRTADAREKFLQALGECGNVTASCHKAGLGRNAVYQWKHDDLDFAAAWEASLDLGIASLEDIAMRMAMQGSEKLIMFLLQTRRPEVYGRRGAIEIRDTIGMRSQPLDAMRAELAALLAAPSRATNAEDDQSANVVALAMGKR